MGLFEDMFSGDVGKALGGLAFENGAEGFVNTLTLGTSNKALDYLKPPDNSALIAQQEAQMQAELLRRARLTNQKDMQASQAAFNTFSSNSPFISTEGRSGALNFIGL